MEPAETRRELQRRMLEWGREEYRCEFAEGFPLLRSVPGRMARLALAAFERSGPEERERLAEALLKRMHCREPGQPPALTPDEKTLVDRFLEETGPDRAKWMEPPKRIPRAATARTVRETLAPLLGRPDKDLTDWPRGVAYVTNVGGWRIDTLVDLDRGIGYAHALRARNGTAIALSTYLGVLGITEPAWEDVVEAEVPLVAQSLASLCRRFLDKAPPLVAGLDPPERGEFDRPRT